MREVAPADAPVELAGDTEFSADQVQSHSWLRSALTQAAANRLAVGGMAIIVWFVLFCFIGPLVYRTNQVTVNLAAVNQPPSLSHLLGTDNLGYDIVGRLMVGGQTSVEIGLAVAILSSAVGGIWGAVAGLLGGAIDSVMMRIVDALLAIPALLLLLVVGTIVVPSVPILIAIIGIVSWTPIARLVRAEALSLGQREFVQAARVSGASEWTILMRHVLPNCTGVVVVNATFTVANTILLVAYLSFLGLGIPPPATNWGAMLTTGVSYVYAGYWWEIWPAGACIVGIVLAFNALGDGVRDAVDVRLRQR